MNGAGPLKIITGYLHMYWMPRYTFDNFSQRGGGGCLNTDFRTVSVMTWWYAQEDTQGILCDVNMFNHIVCSVHFCGFSPLWGSKCLFRCPLCWINFRTLYSNDTRFWDRLDFVIEDQSHYLHWFYFSGECVLMWYLRVPACEHA